MHVLCRGELYPVETDVRLCDVIKTGEEVGAIVQRWAWGAMKEGAIS